MRSAWINLAAGAWILISPWLLGVSGIAIITWSNVLIGLILILLNLWRIYGE